MSDIGAFVGLDVHQEQIAVAIAGTGRDGEVRLWGTVPNKPGAVERLVRKLRERHGRIGCAYEAGPTGYGLYRQLLALGGRLQGRRPVPDAEEAGRAHQERHTRRYDPGSPAASR